MSKIIHDLTNTLPWIDGVKPRCRQYIGHYGDTYVLPVRCGIDVLRRSGVEYGRFHYISDKCGRNSTMSVLYCDNEPQAYAKFMQRLASSSYCSDVRQNQIKMSETMRGEKTAKLYAQLGVPKIYGVCIMQQREKIHCLSSKHLGQQILTYTHQHIFGTGKEAIIQVFKQHLAKMPDEWRASRHIPEIYLDNGK